MNTNSQEDNRFDCAHLNPMPEAAAYRRPPEVVMRLARMGSFPGAHGQLFSNPAVLHA